VHCMTSMLISRCIALLLAVIVCACDAANVVTPSPSIALPGPCEPTKPQPFVGAPAALVGGNLAYLGPAQWRVDTDEKAPWLWRTVDRTQRLRLIAQRLDANRASIEFDLGPPQELPAEVGKPQTTFAPEWGSTIGYGGYVGLGGPKLPELGCWRLSIKSGAPSDAIVVQVITKP
jgi:hypothetical protein